MIKRFSEFVNEMYEGDDDVYEGDIAIDRLLYKVMGDEFLDNRDAILDTVYTTLGMRTINVAFEELSEEYPDLANYQEEFYEAAEKEGYTIMTPDKWESGEIE